MAHEITVRKNGVEEMMYVGDAPWHKLGVSVATAPTIQEAIKLAGMDWKVELKPLYTGFNVETCEMDGQAPAMATVRQDNNEILGVVGKGYKLLQNQEAFDFFQPFIDSGAVALETAGSLKGGKRIWVLAKVVNAKLSVVPGDAIEMYVLLSNSHDGTMAIRVGFTPVRVVCANTEHMAIHHADSKLIRIRHTGDVTAALKSVQEVMDTAKLDFIATVDQYRKMATKAINQADLEKYIRIAFDLKSADEEKRTSKIVESVTKLFHSGKGNDLDGVKGTMWAAYNAATEFIQYERGQNDEQRLDSTWFGTGASINKKAFDTAVEMAAA